MFNEKAAGRLESDKKKASEEEKLVVPRFVFDKRGAPRQNEEYRRQFQHPRPKTFLPSSDIPQEKLMESMNQKGDKRPKWRVLDLEKETTFSIKKVKTRGYVFSPNYKGKTPMTKTQWRDYQ